MIKQKGLHDLFYIFQKLDLSLLVDLEKIQPW